MRKRLSRKPEAGRASELPAVGRELVEQRGIIGRIDDYADVRMILCRGAHQGRSADVNILDGIVERAARSGHGLSKRIEIDHHQIDRWNRVLGERGHVLEGIAASENRAMDSGVQGLDATVEHLRESGVVGDFGDRQPGIHQRFRSAPGGDELDTHRVQTAREFHEACLIGDRQKRLGDRSGHRERFMKRCSRKARRERRVRGRKKLPCS